MAPTFVRYGPAAERADPGSIRRTKKVVDDVTRYVAQSVIPPVNRAIRDAHAKGYGLARAEVDILGGLPAEYAQGIYAQPGSHEAMIRFPTDPSR